MIRIIAALDEKRGIAKHGVQPWYIPDDRRYFMAQTMRFGATALMGRQTFELLKKPLEGRRNLVLSRRNLAIEGIEVVPDLKAVVSQARQGSDIWVIGGAEIYAQVLADADELYITQIAANFGCDRFFPDFEKMFHLEEQSEMHSQNGFNYTFCRYLKNAATS